MKHALLLIAPLLASTLVAQVDTCIDFEGFGVGTSFAAGQPFYEDGVEMIPRLYSSGGEDFFGSAQIVATSPHIGNALGLSNATVEVDFGGCVQEVQLHYGNNGGNLNIAVNGDVVEVKNLEPVYLIGGVAVLVDHAGPGGTMRFIADTATIQTLRIGGQEFVVDHICYLPCENPSCYDFESIGAGQLQAGDGFFDQDRYVEIRPLGSEPGFAESSSVNAAGQLGAELALNGVSAFFDIGCSGGAQFNYGIPDKGFITLVINGETVTTQDPATLHNQTVGDVLIQVSGGQIVLNGLLETLEIGGDGLFVDNLCLNPCPADCIDFEDLPARTELIKGDTLVEDGIEMTVDSLGPEGLLRIESDQRAGHVGQDAALLGASLTFDIPCAAQITLHFGQYAGGVRIGHGGAALDATEMTDLDGQNFQGVQIEVDAVNTGVGIVGTLTLTGEIADFTIGGTELVIDHVCHVPCVNPGCADFEGFPPGRVYEQGDVLTEEYTRMTVADYQPPASGQLLIGADNIAGGSGNEAVLTGAQVLVEFICAGRVEFLYGRPTGGIGGVKLGVNGSVLQINTFTQLHQDFLGGAFIEVFGTAEAGRVVITGPDITSVLIGGNTLAIDSICHDPCGGAANCLNFEALPAAAVYNAADFDIFLEGDALFLTGGFLTAPGELISDGTAAVSSLNRANHFGQELHLTNATVSIFTSISCMTDLSFRFGDYGGKVNLLLNGELVIVDSLTELDGTLLGGALISVNTLPAPGGEVGRLSVSGEVTSLDIGGADLYVDHICYAACPDPIELGHIAILSANPLNETQRQVVIEIPVSGTGTLQLQRSANPASAASWTDHPATITTPPGRPDVRRFTTTVPMSADKVFFRVKGVD
jgi:hypothetical protein